MMSKPSHDPKSRSQAPPPGPKKDVAAGQSPPLAKQPQPAAATRTVSASAPKSTGGNGPSHEQIAVRAYELWEHQGRPHGVDLEHWLEAERQLCHNAR